MIRFTLKYLKPVSLLLVIVFLFQCCKAYDMHPTLIENAVGSQKKYVKIVTVDDREFLFDSIYYKNEVLYGTKKKSTKKNILEIKLREDEIKEVYIHVLNREKSKRRTIVLIAVPGTLILLFGFITLMAYLSIEKGGLDLNLGTF